MQVTKTTNPLPFKDLNHQRFEDLCLGIVLRMRNWLSIRHYGRKGSDRGVDIYTELIEDSQQKSWFIQCKNYQKISLSELKKIIDDVVENNENLPDHYLLILACGVTRNSWEKLEKFAKEKGLTSIDMITSSVLESMLFTRHHDLLYMYFNIDLARKHRNKVTQVKRRLASKKRFESEFAKRNYEMGREIIIHDIHNDEMYPEIPEEWPSKYHYYKVEFFRPYHRGISVISGIASIAVNQEGKWYKCKYDEPIADDWFKINAYVICNLPYDSILAENFDGDEYYPCLHVYCEFRYSGNAYDEIWYEPTSDYKKAILFLEKENEVIQSKKSK